MFPRPAIVLPPYSACYVDIPKVASTTVKTILAEVLGVEHPRGVHFAPFVQVRREVLRSKYPEHFVFAFVRNPWARLLASYRTLIAPVGTYRWGMRNGLWTNLSRFENRFYGEMPFGAFVEQVAQIPDHVSDEHFFSQTGYLRQIGGPGPVDFVGRLERLETDLRYVSAKIGMPIRNVPHLNKKARGDYRRFYSPYTAALVRERYRDDVREFGYEF